VETNADLQVYDLAHLGLVAGIMDRMKLVETVDHQVGPRPNEKVSTGMALKAAILNALGEWAPRRRLDETGSSLPEEGQAYPKTHPALGVPALPLGAPGGAGGQAPSPQPGPPSRDGSPSAGGGAILPPGVRGAECGQKALSPGKPYGQVGQQPLGLLQDPIETGEVGQGGEVGLQGGLGGPGSLWRGLGPGGRGRWRGSGARPGWLSGAFALGGARTLGSEGP